MINYPPNEGRVRVHGPVNSSNIIIFTGECFCLKTVGLQFHIHHHIYDIVYYFVFMNGYLRGNEIF